MKAVFAAIAVFCASTTWSTLASAQEWDPWGRAWDAPSRGNLSDAYRYQDRDDYDDRADPRVTRRFDNDDDRRYDPRYNDERDNSERRSDRRRYYDARQYDDRDDYGAWDAAPPPDEERRLSKSRGTSSGNRPSIRAVAPPVVAFSGPYPKGSIVIDTSKRKLYYVLSAASAYAYPIAVGRQGFAWTGKEKISRIADWPDWYPPADMRKRKPSLPKRMLGGIRNPLGAKAIYLGNTLYRIHGTNDPKSIGKAESSGCFRMLNENVLHLASLIHVGTEVTIVRSLDGKIASAASAAKKPKASTRQKVPDRRSYERDDDDDPYRYEPSR